MNLIKQAFEELLGLFVDDGSLALHLVLLIALVTLAVKFASLSPLLGALAILAGCLVILVVSLRKKARGE
ncbi:MAG: hypothetical protein KKF33_14765 [Alphaproteobacteria bacterium]|nr:hypothetical protein [Alphaproteobacteria bacterium]